jgi:hypothetical protein
VSDDQAESILLLANANNGTHSTEATLSFPTFLYYLELLAEATPDYKLPSQARGSGSAGMHKLQALLVHAAYSMLQRRSFQDSIAGGGSAGEGDTVQVFDEERLYHIGVTDNILLLWLRDANAIQVPHVQIPLVVQHLSALAGAQPALVLSDSSDPAKRMWRGSELCSVLYNIVSQLTSFRASAAVPRAHEVLFLLQHVPGVFFGQASATTQGSEQMGSLSCLYSVWTAPLLQDAVEDVNALLRALWVSLLDSRSDDSAGRSDHFTSAFGHATVRVHRALRVLNGSGLVPFVVSTASFFAACGAVLGEDPASFDEESNISQGRLFDTLYVLTCDHWFALENLRRKKPPTAPHAKLSAKQPQRGQQLFQTFVYLLDMRFPFQVAVPPPLPAEAAAAQASRRSMHDDNASSQSTSTEEYNRPALPAAPQSPVRKTALQIISEMINQEPSAAAPQRANQPAQQLTVSFNSNLQIDGSPVRHNTVATTVPRSFFSEHPLRDIAVLLTHYPVPGFSLSPWTMLELLKENSAAFPTAGYGNPSANTDALLTALLSKFCLRFHVSSNDLSQFFASYYLTADTATAAARFKEEAVRSPVMDFLLTDSSISKLTDSTDVLMWEYSRCNSQCRTTGDPLLDSVAVPFLTNIDFDHSFMGRVTSAHVRNWALQRTGLDPDVIDDRIEQVTCLSGEANLRSVSFSAFVLIAARCYWHPSPHDGTVSSAESAFSSALDTMLAECAASYNEAREALKIHVAASLFGELEDLAAQPVDVHARVATAALEQFTAVHYSPISAPAPSLPGAAPAPGDGRIPPRPPKILWDAPRFAQFCRDLGVFAQRDLAISAAWSAFGTLLRREGAPGLTGWKDPVVPPVPMRVDTGLVYKLVTSLSSGKIDSATMFHKSIVPVLCAMLRRDLAGDRKPGQDGLKVEDLLRYGGSAVLEKLAACETSLRRTYRQLCDESASLLCEPTGEALVVGGNRTQAEAALTVLCRHLGLSGILRPTTVALQIKRSLHVRLRPGFRALLPGSPQMSPEVVTLSYQEFEEVCFRAAFLVWETSGAIGHPQYLANEAALLGQAHLSQQGGLPTETTAAASAYVMACAAHSVAARSAAEAPSEQRSSWGVDFLGPFLACLELSVAKQASQAASLADTDPVRRTKGSVRFGKDVVLNEAELAAAQEPGSDSKPPLPRKSSIFPALPREVTSSPTIDLTARSPSPNSSVRFSGTSHQHLSTSPLNDRDRQSSPTPKMQPSQRIIQNSTERFLQRQESTEQFVVAVDSLLKGTKEALWPVYATYCSCGDSLDPGKLSGPNLFTLLSKLAVLTDRTSLSDVGILLHQTAAHTLTGPSANAVAMLYESGAYFEAHSLSFEEFIVFLCAFSQLRYHGEMLTPETFHLSSGAPGAHGPTTDNWFKQWQEFMGKSNAFRNLLGECVLPILQKQMLLAFPEDARLRDRFCCVFSIEVLIAIEGVEGPLLKFFETERSRESNLSQQPTLPTGSGHALEISAIITALKRINLIPKVMAEPQVLQLIQDVLPEQPSKRRCPSVAGEGHAPKKPSLLFPQWEWVLSVVAFQAVVAATEQSAVPTEAEVRVCLHLFHSKLYNACLYSLCAQKIPGMVADVISSIASAITQQL